MNVLFIHPNFPGQFGAIINHLATVVGWNCTFLTSVDTRHLELPFNHINYKVHSEELPKVFWNPPTIQGFLDHMTAIYLGLRQMPQYSPDLVVGHTSYGTMLYLRVLYPRCPFVGYFDMHPAPFWTDGLVLREEYPPPEDARLFNATYHFLNILHLHHLDAAYTHSEFQRSLAPPELRHKIRVFPDGVDVNFFQPRRLPRPATFRDLTFPPETRLVTYMAQGLEAVFGFDVFMNAARQIAERLPSVQFLVIGEDRTLYGHEQHYIGAQKSFKQHVLEQGTWDLDRFHFLGAVNGREMAELLNLSDLHVYLSAGVPLLPWLKQGLASGCLILGSATPPVQEVVEDGVTGLLVGFKDTEALAARAIEALQEPARFQHLREAARRKAVEQYESRQCLTNLAQFLGSFGTRARDDLFASLGGR